MNYTQQANEVLKTAKKVAKELNHPYIGTEHLLIGLRKVYGGVAGQILGMNDVKEESVLKIVDELVSPAKDVAVAADPEMSPRLSYILEEAKEEAVRLKSAEIGTEHMLLAMIRDMDCVGTRILMTLNINLQKVCQDILQTVGVEPKEYMDDVADDGRRKMVYWSSMELI